MSDQLVVDSRLTPSAGRLVQERKRLGFRQAELASNCGWSTTTQGNYERGERSPDIRQLLTLADAGVDIVYVISGQRFDTDLTAQHVGLSRTEVLLLANFRSCDSAQRLLIGLVAEQLAAKPKACA